MSAGGFKHLLITHPSPFVAHVEIARPQARNALHEPLWVEIGACFDGLARDADTRAIVLSGQGKAFCADIDLKVAMEMFGTLCEFFNGHDCEKSRRKRKCRCKSARNAHATPSAEGTVRPKCDLALSEAGHSGGAWRVHWRWY